MDIGRWSSYEGERVLSKLRWIWILISFKFTLLWEKARVPFVLWCVLLMTSCSIKYANELQYYILWITFSCVTSEWPCNLASLVWFFITHIKLIKKIIVTGFEITVKKKNKSKWARVKRSFRTRLWSMRFLELQ